MSLYFKYILLFSTILFIASCYEDILIDTPLVEKFEPSLAYLNEIQGIVTDSLGAAIPNVRVRIEGLETSTDSEGRFILFQIPVAQYGSYLDVSKNGFYDTGIRIYPNSALKLNTVIIMVEKDKAFSFDSNAGAQLVHRTGLSMDIAPNSFVKNGNVYLGQVHINIFWVNPSDLNSFRQHIQVYESIIRDQINPPYRKPNFLSTAYISVTDETGAPLDVAPNLPIEVRFPDPNNDISTSSSHPEVQLLSFAEEKGLWIEEGSAFKEDDSYRAQLTHFSWWTIAYTQSGTELCIDFNTTTSGAANDHLFTVSKTDGTIVFLGGVNYEAPTCIPIPLDEHLEIRVYNYCFQLLGSFPYEGTNAESANLTIDINSEGTVVIEGKVLGCDGLPYGSPVEIIYSTDRSQDNLGTFTNIFEISLDPCFAHDILYIIARDDQKDIIGASEVNLLNLSSSRISTNITLCGNQLSDGSLTLDGITYDNAVARKNKDETLIIVQTDKEPAILIGIDGFEVGTFTARLLDQKGNICEGTATITQYGEVGETIEGTISTPMNDSIACPGYEASFKAVREK